MKRLRKPLVQAAIAVLERNGRYLIARRRRGQHLAGYWEFPGGKREPGETWAACLRREVREETGLTARVGRRLMTLEHAYDDRTVRLAVFHCTMMSGRARQGTAWVTCKQLARRRFPPANRPLLDLLLSRCPS